MVELWDITGPTQCQLSAHSLLIALLIFGQDVSCCDKQYFLSTAGSVVWPSPCAIVWPPRVCTLCVGDSSGFLRSVSVSSEVVFSTACIYLSIFQGAWGIHHPFSSWWGALLQLIQDTFRSGLHRKSFKCSSVVLHQSQGQTGHASRAATALGFPVPVPFVQVFWLLGGHSHYWTALSWFCSCPWLSELSAVFALIHSSIWPSGMDVVVGLLPMLVPVLMSCFFPVWHLSNSKEMLHPESTQSKWLVLNKTFLCSTEMV